MAVVVFKDCWRWFLSVLMPFDFPLESQLPSRSKTPNQNASLHNDSSYSNLVVKTPRNTRKHLQNTCILPAETLVEHGIWKMKEKKVKF